jgi:thioredoxin 1
MAHESIVNLTAANFADEVKNSTVPVLVDFWAEWCGPCKMLGPVLDELAAEKGGTAKICKVDIMDQQELATQFGVQAIPLLLFFKDGELKDKIPGLASKDEISKRLSALA